MRVLHMIGNAHLDPVWLWRWQEGFAEIKATFRSALDRMREYEDFVFTCSSAAYYRWVEENEPRMFEEIRERVKEGRWVIVGGFWIQPDCNIPSGESFVRHGLYSQRYFLDRFGRKALVGYNPDSFGHAGSLPQILKGCGMDSYVFMRPNAAEKTLPCLFRWEGVDGSQVLAFRISESYNSPWPLTDEARLCGKIEKIRDLAEKTGRDQMAFYGVGNHGGGPTKRNIETIRGLKESMREVELRFSSPDEYFRSVEAIGDGLPLVKGDLQHHSSGCYSAMSEVKESNRKTEFRLLEAEKLCALAGLLLDFAYPRGRLTECWEKLLFNQFHDILGGCAVKGAYDDARESFGFALHGAAEACNAALQKISWNIDTSRDLAESPGKEDWISWEAGERGQPFVVFNPHSWDLRAPIRINRDLGSIYDDEGREQALQKIRGERTNEADKWDSIFMGELPAMGYRVFWGSRKKAALAPAAPAPSDDSVAENERFRLELDPSTGGIASLFDKRDGREVFAGTAALAQVIDERHCDTWAHGVFAFDKALGSFGEARIGAAERGPVRSLLRSTSRWGDSTLVQEFALYAGSDRVDVSAKVDWREKHAMLKLSFPAALDETRASYEIPYGFIEKDTDGLEEPAGKWADLSGLLPDRSSAGFAILNVGKYSYDAKGPCLRLTVLRSPIYADHYGQRDDGSVYMDQGEHRFAYSIYPHAGSSYRAGMVRAAYELNAAPRLIAETYHPGPLARFLRTVEIDADGIVAEAFKESEDGAAYILRCYETTGSFARARIALPPLSREFFADFGPSSIKTFRIPKSRDEAVSECDMLELGAAR